MRFRISASQRIGPGMYVSVGKCFGGHARRHGHRYLLLLTVLILVVVVLSHMAH